MRVRLETLCGCSRELDFPRFLPEIQIPIIRPILKVDEPVVLSDFPRRRFRYDHLDVIYGKEGKEEYEVYVYVEE